MYILNTCGPILNALGNVLDTFGTHFDGFVVSLGTCGDTLGAIGHHLDQLTTQRRFYHALLRPGRTEVRIWNHFFTKIAFVVERYPPQATTPSNTLFCWFSIILMRVNDRKSAYGQTSCFVPHVHKKRNKHKQNKQTKPRSRSGRLKPE